MDKHAIKIKSVEDIPDLSKVFMFVPFHFFSPDGQSRGYKMTLYTREETYAADFETYDGLNAFFHSMTKLLDKDKVVGYTNCVRATELR